MSYRLALWGTEIVCQSPDEVLAVVAAAGKEPMRIDEERKARLKELLVAIDELIPLMETAEVLAAIDEVATEYVTIKPVVDYPDNDDKEPV